MAVLTEPRVTATVTARWSAVALVAAGVLFVVYPALRPYAADGGPDGVAQLASPAWPLAHVAGMVAFLLVPAALLGLRARIGGALATAAVVTTWAGAGLVLPYYGAEAFALHAVGLQGGDPAVVDAIRNGALQLTTFGAGLVLLAVGPVVAAVAVWRSGVVPRASALLFALGLALYLPQFYAPPALRIAHGVLLGVGCLVLAAGLSRPAARPL
jgi:hypothetical protein